MQLSFDDYGNERHHQLFRRFFDQTNHLKGKIMNDYKMHDAAECRRNLEFIWSPWFHYFLAYGMNTETYSEPCQTSKMEPLTIFAKQSIVDVRQGSACDSGMKTGFFIILFSPVNEYEQA